MWHKNEGPKPTGRVLMRDIDLLIERLDELWGRVKKAHAYPSEWRKEFQTELEVAYPKLRREILILRRKLADVDQK